jgi:hypothetical protein
VSQNWTNGYFYGAGVFTGTWGFASPLTALISGVGFMLLLVGIATLHDWLRRKLLGAAPSNREGTAP